MNQFFYCLGEGYALFFMTLAYAGVAVCLYNGEFMSAIALLILGVGMNYLIGWRSIFAAAIVPLIGILIWAVYTSTLIWAEVSGIALAVCLYVLFDDDGSYY